MNSNLCAKAEYFVEAKRAFSTLHTAEEVESYLTHSRPSVRLFFVLFKTFQPTLFQLERGLADPDPSVRKAFRKREADWRLTAEFNSLQTRHHPPHHTATPLAL